MDEFVSRRPFLSFFLHYFILKHFFNFFFFHFTESVFNFLIMNWFLLQPSADHKHYMQLFIDIILLYHAVQFEMLKISNECEIIKVLLNLYLSFPYYQILCYTLYLRLIHLLCQYILLLYLNNSLLFCGKTKLFTLYYNLIKLNFRIFVIDIKFLKQNTSKNNN